MKYNIIICDTREKQNKKIFEYFKSVKQDYIISKLETGDYMLYNNYDVIIDKKNGLLELCNNLCHTEEHQRIVREIMRAKKYGCQKFIFLIQDDKIKTEEDIKNWTSKYTKVKGITLLKIMKTMQEKYKIHFAFVSRNNFASKIIELLGAGNEN